MMTIGLVLLLVGCSRAPLPTPTPGGLAIPLESVVDVAPTMTVEPVEVESAENDAATPTVGIEATSEATIEPTTTVIEVEESAENGDESVSENDAAVVETEASQPITYVVQAGDALELIALSLNVDLFALAEANNIVEFDQIEIGQQLIVPVQVETSEPGDEEPDRVTPVEYTVVAGDALSLLAERFGITTAELAAANGLSVTDDLLIGQLLIIPSQ